MSNDLVNKAMEFVFGGDQRRLREKTIYLLSLHRQPEAGGVVHDIMNLGVRYRDTVWSHPDRPKQIRGMTPIIVVNVLSEHETIALNLHSDFVLLEKDSKRAHKTLTQLVRGMHTDQDLRDSLPDCLSIKLGFGYLPRTREPAFRYAAMEPRVHVNILKDLEMIQGYIDSRLLLS